MNKRQVFLRAFLLLSFCVIFLTVGCRLFDNNPGSPTSEAILNQGEAAKGVAGSVSFSIRFPATYHDPGASQSAILPSILASSETAPTVTFKLQTVNTGLSGPSSSTFVKTVPVNATEGTAEVTFSNIPAGPCIGDVSIVGGHINSFKEFHGMHDLIADNPNTIIIVPKNTGLLEDIMVRVVLKGLSETTTPFTGAPSGLTEWLRLLLSKFNLGSTTIVDEVFTDLKASFARGYAIQTKTEAVSVALPPGTTLSTATLKIVSPFSEATLNEAGNTSVQQVFELAPNTASLLVCENESGNAVMMKMGFDSSSTDSNSISLETTAEALVMIDPFFTSLSATQVSQARLALKQHSQYQNLLQEVQKAILNKPDDPFDPATQDALYEKICIISKDVYTSVLPKSSLRFSSKTYNGPEFTSSTSGESADNNSYCNYVGEIKKDYLFWKDLYLNRKSLFGGFWPSPQVCFDNKVMDWLFSGDLFNPRPGDCLFEISFNKDPGMTLTDGILGLLLSCAGVAKPALNEDIRALAKDVGNTWKTLKALSTSNSPGEVAGNLLKLVLENKEMMRRITIIIFRSAAKGSWVRTVLRAVMKKLLFWITVGEITYQSTELVFIVNSAINDPSSISEKAFIRGGTYPVGSITSIILKNVPEKLEAGQTFDLNDIEIEVNYDKVERTIVATNDEVSKQTLVEAMTRTHTSNSPAFPNGVSQVEWSGQHLNGTIFTAPVDAGNYKIQCTYSEGTADKRYPVNAEIAINVMGITALSFKAPPKLLVGEELDLNQVKVTAEYSDGSSKVVTATWSGEYVTGGIFKAPAIGQYKALCTYSESNGVSSIEKKAEMNIVVVSLNSITLNPVLISTYAEQTFDLAKIGVEANFSDGSKEEETDQTRIAWTMKSGAGSVNGSTYTAPVSTSVSSKNEELLCRHTRAGKTVEAVLQIKVAAGRFTRDKAYPNDPNNQQTVLTDNLNGTQWIRVQYVSGEYKTWYEFRDLAGTVEFAGGGWRMPTLNEALSVIPEGYEAGEFMAPNTYSTAGYIWTLDDRYTKEPPNSQYDPTLEPTHQTIAVLSANGLQTWRYASTAYSYTFFMRSKQ